jgi:hypothetical protein
VHGANDIEFREPVVPDLPRHQVLRDDSLHLAARPQHGVRDHTHEAHVAAAVDQPDIAAHKFRTQLLGCCSVFGVAARTGAAEHADSFHPVILSLDFTTEGAQMGNGYLAKGFTRLGSYLKSTSPSR